MASGVYRGADGYLRIGSRSTIASLLARHQMLAAAGFPVARIIRSGEHEGLSYYVEASLGEERLGIRFRREWEGEGVSTESFDSFVEMTLRFSEAQIAAGALLGDSTLRSGINLDTALSEAETDSALIEARFLSAARRLERLPIVACHGDYNPQNILPQGVIDLEDMFAGPLGYDQVSGIYTTELNPVGAYEFPARYRFSDVQVEAYYAALDALFGEHSLPPLSSFRRDLEFCRAVWAATRMHEWPKTEEWRYAHLRGFFDDTIG